LPAEKSKPTQKLNINEILKKNAFLQKRQYNKEAAMSSRKVKPNGIVANVQKL
jgi:hypothetical protein